VDENDERIFRDLGKRGPNRLSPSCPTRHTRHDLRRRKFLRQEDRRLFPARYGGDDNRVDPRRPVEPVEALGEQRPATKDGKRLGAIDSEPFAGARGDEQCPDISGEAGNV